MTLFIGPWHGGDEPLMSNDSAARSTSLPPVFVMRIAILQRLVDDAVGIDEGLAVVDAVGDGRDLLAHLARRAALELDDRGVDGGVAVAVEQRARAAPAPVASAAACALMSPMRWSAMRMFDRMIDRISSSSTPCL